MIADILKKLNNSSIIFLCIIFAIIFLCIGGCKYFNECLGLDDDHEVEEQAENIVKHFLGVEMDFTGESLEK